jgi:enamine deaminase RidA (YjgF/YER057c/UK114 family)
MGNHMEKEFLNPPDLPNWSHAFSQVVIVKAGGVRTIYVSGQVSVDERRELIGAGDLEAQAEQTFHNLSRALAAAGAVATDVVKVGIYVKHYQASDAAVVGAAFRRVFPHDLPASTWLGVDALAEEGFLIEVDAVAVAKA